MYTFLQASHIHKVKELGKCTNEAFSLLGIWLLLIRKGFSHSGAEDLCNKPGGTYVELKLKSTLPVLPGVLSFLNMSLVEYVPISAYPGWTAQVLPSLLPDASDTGPQGVSS